MRLLSARHEYDYSWEEVSTNNWRKYCPWNDKAEHVIGVDVLNRSLDSETGIVSSPRIYSPNNRPLLTAPCPSSAPSASSPANKPSPPGSNPSSAQTTPASSTKSP